MGQFLFERKFKTTKKDGFDTFLKYKLITIPSEFKTYLDEQEKKETYKLIIDESIDLEIQNLFNRSFTLAGEELRDLVVRKRICGNTYQPDIVFKSGIVIILKNIFFSTFVCSKVEYPILEEDQESLTLEIDTEKKTVCIKQIKVYSPDTLVRNPFYEYMKSFSKTTQFDFLTFQNGDEDGAVDFYKGNTFSEWKTTDQLENDHCNLPGIYMLFDEKINGLYVGKADNIKARLIGHQKDEKDSMKNFTHYRFTLVNEKYNQLLFLIENTAIHDVACIFNILKPMDFKYPLNSIISDIKLSDIKLMNKHEHQTKLNKRK